MGVVSVALIDDQVIFAEGFAALCAREPEIQLVAVSAIANDAPAIVAKFSPTILFIDVATVENAFPTISTIAARCPRVKIVALTAARSIAFAIRTLDAGVHGYVLKQSSSSEVSQAIRELGRGEKFITHGFASKIVGALQDEAVRKSAAAAVKLSVRENQIVRLLLAGKTNKAIASTLSISEKTVKHYMTLLMQKLNARNRLEVVIAAQRMEDTSSIGGQVH